MDDQDHGPYSRAPEVEDLVRVCRALNDAGARYVLIGGFAMILHGSVRGTKDVDFLVDASIDNMRLVKRALAVLEDNAAAEVQDDDVKKYQVVRIADEIVVDLLGQACGIQFADILPGDVETMPVEGVKIPVASKALLIRTKDTFRETDKSDVQYLRARLTADAES